ncbi:MAG: 3-phosphoshikimate 1-carboxyvinyltransferase [bacterium]
MNITIHPKKLNGTINVIASKSCLHRAIIAASLANGKSVIENVLYSKDVEATIGACTKLGATILNEKDKLIIHGCDSILKNQNIDCIESGSTLRFMIPIFHSQLNQTNFTGAKSLFNRPLDVYFDIFDEQNIKYEFTDSLEINGVIKSGIFEIDGKISSQFITGLMYTLPLLDGDSKIVVKNDLESKGYIDLTIDILMKFNIKVINNNYKEFIIKGNQKFISTNYIAESDYSQASFFLVANELGNRIEIKNLNYNSLQPDKKIINDIECIMNNKDVDLSQNPDCGPILSILALLHNTQFINAKRLRIKESDRITSMVTNLNKLGANLIECEEGINFTKVNNLDGDVEVDCFNDHRVCMALAIASTICNKKIKLIGAQCVDKSYPNFWDDFKKLGGVFDVE